MSGKKKTKKVDPKKKKTPIYKGFINGVPEAGIHGHTLIRELRKTRQDGRHPHLYIIQDHLVLTDIDGAHPHGMVNEAADKLTRKGSKHSHTVIIPIDITMDDGTILPEGTKLFTELDGDHDHLAMVETSAFDGIHAHVLVLPDGSRMRSYLPGEFWEWRGSMQQDGLPDFPTSPEITRNVEVFSSPLFKHDEVGDNDPASRGGTNGKEIRRQVGGRSVLQKEDAVSPDRLLALAALGFDVEVVGKQNVDDDEFSPEIQKKIAAAERMVPREVMIAKQDDDLRIAYGVVLIPEFRDGEKDIISADEVRESAHFFMLRSRVIGFRHRRKSKAKLVESYLAPQPLTFKGQKGTQKVPTGTWIIGIFVPDDKEWADIKSGKIAAFSPGGFSRKLPG